MARLHAAADPELTSKRRAALVTGFAHGLFHLPLILIATTYDAEGPRWIAAPAAVLTITAAGVFYAWLWDRSGSPWAVTIGHTTANLTFALGFSAVASTTSTSLAFGAGETGVATLAVVVALAVVLLKNATVWQEPKVVVRVPPEKPARTPFHSRARESRTSPRKSIIGVPTSR